MSFAQIRLALVLLARQPVLRRADEFFIDELHELRRHHRVPVPHHALEKGEERVDGVVEDALEHGALLAERPRRKVPEARCELHKAVFVRVVELVEAEQMLPQQRLGIVGAERRADNVFEVGVRHARRPSPAHHPPPLLLSGGGAGVVVCKPVVKQLLQLVVGEGHAAGAPGGILADVRRRHVGRRRSCIVGLLPRQPVEVVRFERSRKPDGRGFDLRPQAPQDFCLLRLLLLLLARSLHVVELLQERVVGRLKLLESD